MNRDDETRTGFSLRRWSARKHAAAREATPAPPLANEPPMPAAPAGAATPDTLPSSGLAAPSSPLPPVESLTSESDFVPFMQGGVDETLKRSALKKLFSDPHFNVMDGLDVYIDDYSKPDPIEPELIRQLAQSRYIFDPPPTHVNDQGFVEDTPKPELSAAGPPQGANCSPAGGSAAAADASVGVPSPEEAPPGPAGVAAVESKGTPPAEVPERPKMPEQGEIPLPPRTAEPRDSK
jgi:hypothetical protein